MKLSIPMVCPACGDRFGLDVSGGNLPDYSQCPKCGARPYNNWPLRNIVTLLLVERAKQELANGDVTLAILLCAVAVEAETAHLFLKWRGIDSGKILGNQTPEDRKHWQDEWAKMRSIGRRLDELSRFLTRRPFDEFARLKMDILKPALMDYDPATSIKDYFQEQFFDRRNDFVHYGKIDFQEADGRRCLSLASALLELFHAMDMRRAEALEEAHRNAREKAATTAPQSTPTGSTVSSTAKG
jgi:hypothetical protein